MDHSTLCASSGSPGRSTWLCAATLPRRAVLAANSRAGFRSAPASEAYASFVSLSEPATENHTVRPCLGTSIVYVSSPPVPFAYGPSSQRYGAGSASGHGTAGSCGPRMPAPRRWPAGRSVLPTSAA